MNDNFKDDDTKNENLKDIAINCGLPIAGTIIAGIPGLLIGGAIGLTRLLSDKK